MPHNHTHSHDDAAHAGSRLLVAIGLNLTLTVVEIAAGVLTGSLALAADGVHNLNDCASLIVALVAQRIAQRPSDERRTFGYRRVETIGALVNLSALAMVGVYLAYQAIYRLFQPNDIDGWVVVVVALIALVINLATAGILHGTSRVNMNLRAAFLHNLGDALSSASVALAGAALLLFGVTWIDAVVTLAISGFILWQSFPTIARCVRILLESVPADIRLDELTAELARIDGVAGVHHVHVWEMDESHRALEAHVVTEDNSVSAWSRIKGDIKLVLLERFRIHHSTLEFETTDEAECAACLTADDRRQSIARSH